MIFTSWSFLIAFLPAALCGYILAARCGRVPAVLWLVAASVIFYGFWAPYLIILISCSIAFNYATSVAIRRTVGRPGSQAMLLAAGVICNLAALFYYKYAFAVIGFLTGLGYLKSFEGTAPVALPLGISFFTFTQIGYLVDCKDGVTRNNDLLDYVLFVTFFPHLIAGPILHNGEMMPQIANAENYGLQAKNVAAGLSLFVLGMLKKSLLADSLAPQVQAGFAASGTIQAAQAWLAVLSYSMQLYFDFSGYTDMAIGLAMLFNLRFPPNFNSPYKARNIIEFWQRWHMSLTRYLTQYVYNPIAIALRRARAARGEPMNRKALQTPRSFFVFVAYPTMVTMTLAGIWHGAGLQFVVFGALHGSYLIINHIWRMFGPKASAEPRWRVTVGALVIGQVLLTYIAVLIGQVFFRAASCGEAVQMLAGMLVMHGLESGATPAVMLESPGIAKRIFSDLGLLGVLTTDQIRQSAAIVLLFLIVWFLPNTQQIMASAEPILGRISQPAPAALLWRPSARWAVIMSLATLIAALSLGGTSEFLYFQF